MLTTVSLNMQIRIQQIQQIQQIQTQIQTQTQTQREARDAGYSVTKHANTNTTQTQ